jgi:hypothetical protein
MKVYMLVCTCLSVHEPHKLTGSHRLTLSFVHLLYTDDKKAACGGARAGDPQCSAKHPPCRVGRCPR